MPTDPDLLGTLRDLVSQGLTSKEMVPVLEQRFPGRTFKANTLRSVIRRAQLRAPDTPPPTRRTWGNWEYLALLGPIATEHNESWPLRALRVDERIRRGDPPPESDDPNSKAARSLRLLKSLREEGQVIDYDPVTGPYARPALPWELGSSLVRQPVPADAIGQLEQAISSGEASPSHLEHWSHRLMAMRADADVI